MGEAEEGNPEFFYVVLRAAKDNVTDQAGPSPPPPPPCGEACKNSDEPSEMSSIPYTRSSPVHIRPRKGVMAQKSPAPRVVMTSGIDIVCPNRA